MEAPKLVTVAELVNGGRPLTAADSLHSQLLPRPSASSKPPSDSSSNPRILTPLTFPAIIVGTITLPLAHSAPNSALQCPYGSCLQFSDGSAMICCDVLDLDLQIIGKKIQILAWNFLPIKRGGGFLEIIRWNFLGFEIDRPRISHTHSYSLDSSTSSAIIVNSKSRHRLHGILELISPISVNPCSSEVSNTSQASYFRGFLVKLKICECRLCSSRGLVQEQNNHCFAKPILVYFCGSALSWHSVITKFVGRVVKISGLKKKLVCLGKEESCVMYVTTEKSCINLPKSPKNFISGSKPRVEGKGECGSYTGLVKGVYLQGMVVELDNEVWLLLTNHLITAPHSLRVGAIISVRNVHFWNPDFSWSKMLILGACYKTSIEVKCFSPGMAGCHILSQSASMLGNFIESIAFPARLWVLLIVSCFRKKFSGILSEKEILGTKNKQGLVQMYASSQLPSYMLQTSGNQHGVFMSLCKQDSFCCEGQNGNLKLVFPVCTFIHRCNAKWVRTIDLENDKMLCEGRCYSQSIRKVFSSEEIGVVLIGSLKISASSGRLQLVDATGGVDIIIPDLPTSWNSKGIYEVVDYILVIEGIPGLVDCLGLADKSFSCRSIFNFIPPEMELSLTVYVLFHLRDAACINNSLYPCSELGEELERLECEKYHLLQVTHKFPVLEKFRGDTAVPNAPSVFAEAVINGWSLLLSGNDETKKLGEDSKKHTRHCEDNVSQEHFFKRRKTYNAESCSIPSTTATQLSSCSNRDTESGEKQMNNISCSATVKAAKNQRVVHSAMLRHTGAKIDGSDAGRPMAPKVLLEFEHESINKYQIGCYYIIEHNDEECFCKYKDPANISGIKIRLSSKLHLWSLSFAQDVPHRSSISNHLLSNDMCSDSDNVSSRDHNEVRLNESGDDYLESSSDVFLSVPANRIGIVKVNRDELEEGMIKSAVTNEEIPEVSAYARSVSSAPLLLPINNFLLPEGNLLSLRGLVAASHGTVSNLNNQNVGDTLHSRKFSGTSSSCLHLLVEQRIVKIFGFADKHFFPTGFGSGVDVTFHRVLELRERDRWMLTPVSFITINSLRIAKIPSSERPPCFVLDGNDVTPLENLSLGLISELVQNPNCKLMRLRCRVVAVNILVFETGRSDVSLQRKLCLRQPQVDIPIAGFVLDDGSSSCCCWTSAEGAATFLRLLEELPNKASKSSDRRLNERVKTDSNTYDAIIYRLSRILRKHVRITVKNFGPLFDSSTQELAVSVSSGNALSQSDENFIKFIVFNACAGSSWTVFASLMDSNTVGHLEKQQNLLQSEMTTNCMQNIWAKDVHHTNPFTEANAILQELLDSGPVKY